ALGTIGGPEAVPPLATALRDDRSHLRQAAAKALAAIGGDEARGTLLAALGHKDPATRASVAQALATLADTRAVSALAAALGDREKAVRESAVAALGALGSSDAIEALLAAFEGQDRDVRQIAAAVLRERPWSPANPRQRAIRAVLLGEFGAALAEGAAATGPLLIALQDKDGRARSQAAEALGAIGDPRAVGPLVDALADHDDQVRTAAAQALARLGPAAAPAVIEALGARSGPVRAAASEILARIGEERAIAPLLSELATVRTGHGAARRPMAAHHGVEVALLGQDEDVVQVRRTAETLRTLLTHAAARVPVPDLERAAGLRDLVEAISRDPRGGSAPVLAEEVSCADVRELARQELARRRGTVSPS
ncbi:MAG: HEAT repeat domain-containing protein, partial [Acidobacteria bacterium]|nr:HEAT repeat domain-containing protein [Acidobacteriota bacterium]